MNELMYNVLLSEIEFSSKPSNPRDFAPLQIELQSELSEELTLEEILEGATNGQTLKNGKYVKKLTNDQIKELENRREETPGTTEVEFQSWIEQYKSVMGDELKNEFVSADLAVLDVDDVIGTANPVEVMKASGAVALYYTFSHGEISPINTEMSRYRLLFDLSDTVEGVDTLNAVQEVIKDRILEEFPYLHKQKFGNKSHDIENLNQLFFGTDKGYEFNEDYVTVEVEEIATNHLKNQQFDELVKKMEMLNRGNSRTDTNEILEMADFLGDMNGKLDYTEWISLAMGLWNTAQFEGIEDSIIVEALQILDGNNQSEEAYMDLKKPLDSVGKPASIGTLIKIATDGGFERQYKQQPEQDDEQGALISTRVHKIDSYIRMDSILDIIENDDQRVIIQADTNTGKTTASVNASKAYLRKNKKAFVYIALPTIALSEQLVKEADLNEAVMGNVNVKHAVQTAIRADKRLLVGTYDKAPMVHSYLDGYEVIVIADEVHKEVSDYTYRFQAIQGLFDLDVPKFIGLSGTPGEIDKSSYDRLEKFELKKPKVLANQLQFVNYMNAGHYESVTTKIIEAESRDNKVLAFVNNKTTINKMAKALRQKGLTVATITSDDRRSETYTSILEKGKFNTGVDVVLSTVVLSDGININNSENYVCVIAPSRYKGAWFYNIDGIIQSTNRFRNQYSKIIIPTFVKQELEEGRLTKRPYHLEGQYQYLLSKAEIMKYYTQVEFKTSIEDFTPGVAEKLAGLFRPLESDKFNFEHAYYNKHLASKGLPHDEEAVDELEELESKLWDIDTRSIRRRASRDKEHYYSMNPYAFQEAVKDVLTVLEVEVMEAHEYVLRMDADGDIADILEEINKLELDNQKEKRGKLRIILHEALFSKVQSDFFMKNTVNESIPEWKLLKSKMNSMQYKAMTQLVKFADYESSLQELEYVRKNDQMYELINSFKAVNKLEHYKRTDAETVSELIFNTIESNVIGEQYASRKALDEHLEELAKGFKIKKRYTIAKRNELFKGVFKEYFVAGTKKSVRVDKKVVKMGGWKVIEMSDIADRRDIPQAEVDALYENFLYTYRD